MEERVIVSEQKAAKAKKKLCEALVPMSEAELEFQNQRERAKSLYRNTVHSVIKLGDMCLRMIEARKRET